MFRWTARAYAGFSGHLQFVKAEQRQQRGIFLAFAAPDELGDFVLSEHRAPVVPILDLDRVGARPRVGTVPRDLHVQLWFILKRDGEFGVAVRRRVRVGNRLFLVTPAVFGDQVADLSALDAVFNRIDERRFAGPVASIRLDNPRLAFGVERDRIGRAAKPCKTERFDSHGAPSAGGGSVAASRSRARSASSELRKARSRIVPANSPWRRAATAASVGAAILASAMRFAIRAPAYVKLEVRSLKRPTLI